WLPVSVYSGTWPSISRLTSILLTPRHWQPVLVIAFNSEGGQLVEVSTWLAVRKLVLPAASCTPYRKSSRSIPRTSSSSEAPGLTGVTPSALRPPLTRRISAPVRGALPSL